MILTRTPLRITLGGGGTDDPDYASTHGGFAITAAITKYIYIAMGETFDPGYLLRYSKNEHPRCIGDIEHVILREAIRQFTIPPYVEVASFADIPSGTGLGSSAAFTVGLCAAFGTYKKEHTQIGPGGLAHEAQYIELTAAGRPGGKQDHYACAFGGINTIHFGALDTDVEPLKFNDRQLIEHLSLFFTGYSRNTDSILSTQTTEGLDDIKAIGIESAELLKSDKVHEFGELMHTHWQLKHKRSPDMSNAHIDELYEVGRNNGAIGGKLVGAGGGGFLLFVTDDKNRLGAAMKEVGTQEVNFDFDYQGAMVVAQ